MERSSRPPRTWLRLPDSLLQQLEKYSLCASAAGVGMLALASPAEAKIIYTKAHDVIGPKGSFNLDLNHDGKTDFTIQDRSANSTSGHVSSLFLSAAGTNGVEGVASSNRFLADKLAHGTRIPKGKFSGKATMAFFCSGFFSCIATSSRKGQWFDVSNQYLGLKFAIGGKIHYGWARMNVQFSHEHNNFKATLTGYAYETVPNKPIIAGKTNGPDVITLPVKTEAGTLGHLALGRK